MFLVMACLLTAVTILMGIRLCILHRMSVPVADGRKALLKYYLVFTLGYILRVLLDSYGFRQDEQTFLKEICFDLSVIFSEAIPILAILVFHY